MKDNTNMDKLVREKLDDFTLAPPSHVWGNIQEQLAAERRKKRRLFIAWVSAAAVVVFAFMAGWYFNDRTGSLNPDLFENEITQQNIEKGIEEIQNENLQEPEKREEALKKESGNINLAEALIEEPQKARITLNENRKESNVTEPVEKSSYRLLESLEAMFTFNSDEINLAEQSEQKIEPHFTEIDKLLIAENIRNNKKQRQKDDSWIVGANVSAAYSSHTASYSSNYSQDITSADNTSYGNVGGGISVQYKTNKRLRIESGIYYSPNGQISSSNLDGIFDFSSDGDMAYASLADVSEGESVIYTAAAADNDGGVIINSTAGVVDIDNMASATLLTNTVETADGYNSTFTSSGELAQVFEFIEVPLYARYALIDKQFGIELLGGFNACWLVGNNVYINNRSGKQRVGSTKDISTLNFSGTIGLGFSYSLSKHLSLGLEPRLNYYLNSISSNPDVNYRPYNIGIYTGVYYEF